ncbi:unnamed protein product [Auanema sp. JU1783]|nr:unnamed protein product [Auanema sp. JU1783]
MDEKEFGRLVWAPDAQEGYVLGTLTDISTTRLTITRKDGKSPTTITAPYEEVFLAEEDVNRTVDDNCALMYLNEGTLLNNCRLRYFKREIYSYVANILLSINPYELIPKLYSNETINDYRGKSIGQRPPHVYAIADKAYRDMIRLKQSQSIVVSGESGAGKTESQKAILKYLCSNWGEEADLIRRKIKETNPILEAFGNAKTTRNNNSSRFGKFVEIHFNGKGQVAGGYVSHYLLEKSRVCKQSEGERSYHIFYQLISGLDDVSYKKLHLSPVKDFHYLKHGVKNFFAGSVGVKNERCSVKEMLSDPIVDDPRDFSSLEKAFKTIGLDNQEILNIWRIIAGILHLGNISFVNSDDSKGGSNVDPVTENSLLYASELLGVTEKEFRSGLTTRIMQPTRGGGKLGTIIQVPLKAHEAASARDALAKELYSKLFDYLVSRINACINETPDGSVKNSQFYIGVLDIAGFEFFTVNSFEQFCINFCNEKLQNFFNERILKQEQELYQKEGLAVPKIEFFDNEDCIDLFERKASGLLDLMDEEARLPRPSPQHYTQQCLALNKNHFRLENARKSRLRTHRDMREDEGFLIRHYAGSVCYQTQEFLDKNNDQLHHSLQFLIEESSFKFLCKLFESEPIPVASPQKVSKKLQSLSVCSKFRTQLNVLVEKLRNTGTHFIRCIKPNSNMHPKEFDGLAILGQLRCAGMGSVLKLMQKGYPNRTSFNDLYDTYKKILPQDLARLHPRLFCKCLFRALGMNESDSCFGLTKVFFRAGKFAEFDQLMKQDPESMKAAIKKVRLWLIRSRWRKAQYGAWMVIKLKNKIAYRNELVTRLQANVRGYIARKEFKPRIELHQSCRSLTLRADQAFIIIKELDASNASRYSEVVKRMLLEISGLTNQVKSTQTNLSTAKAKYDKVSSSVDALLAELKREANNERAKQRLRLAEKEKEKEEARIAEQQENEKRQAHERQTRKALEEESQRSTKEWQSNRQITDEKRNAQTREDRLDSQIAVRLARDDHQAIIDIPPPAIAYQKPSGKYNLSEWKAAELRDTINTSVDIELVVACNAEYTRRTILYNEWKAAHRR